MLEQREKFARLATLEMGKRIAEISASILKCTPITLKHFSRLGP
jgi:hypothetical protein